MKNLKLTKKQFAEIESGETIELTLGGFPAYAVATCIGDFVTPNGTIFEVNFYAPNCMTLLINGESQEDQAQQIRAMRHYQGFTK